MPSLLLGCGNSRVKKVQLKKDDDWVQPLITIDMDPDCKPDIQMSLDLDWFEGSLPFKDGQFDHIAAYDVLEHWGKQGDWRGWFNEMREYHRILAPGGTMGILVPLGMDAFADPGHTRFFTPNHFYMLNQKWYAWALEKEIAVTDYRWYWKENFDIGHCEIIGDHHVAAILVKA